LKEKRLPGYPGIIDAFYRAYAGAKDKAIWGDKDPGNMLRIPGLLRWFPDARILHIIRDGRDACLSQLKQDFGFNDCLPCAEAWREQVWWVRQLGELLGPEQYLEVRYEDLVADAEGQLKRISRFLHAAMRACYAGAPVLVDRSEENAVALAQSLEELGSQLVREPSVAG